MKRKIGVEIEVIDYEHCSKKCCYFSIPNASCTKPGWPVNIYLDDTTEQYLRTDKCKEAEIKEG